MRRRLVWVGLALLAAAGMWRVCRDPGIVFLSREGGASWILAREPLILSSKEQTETSARFEVPVEAARPGRYVLEYRLLRSGGLLLDGHELAGSADPARWKQRRQVAFDLVAGPHKLIALVVGRNGPAAFWARCPELGLFTGPDWLGAAQGAPWSPVRLAQSRQRAELSLRFPSVGQALLGRLPFLLAVFALAFAWSLGAQRQRLPALTPQGLQVLLLAAWAVLALNNIARLPFAVGPDVGAHMEYIVYVARRWRLPLANEGWQMFQSPLFYMLSAPIWSAARLFGREAGATAVRFLPFLCGAALVPLCAHGLRLAFPSRRDLQAVGLALGGLLPMTLYSSQYTGNEPLCSALTALTIVLSWRRPFSPRLIGAALGLALLAKATPVLLVLPLFWFMGRELAAGGGRRRVVAGLSAAAGSAILVCGWYYLRNWVELGRPFIGGWDPARGMAWWQEPGFRTFRHVLGFGEALVHPVYSGLSGFWDALYSTFWLDGMLSSMIVYELRPPWDDKLMLAGAWLAVPLTAAVLAGLVRGALDKQRGPLAFSALSVAAYLAALLWLYLCLPIYSTAKATYMGGLAPCFAVLFAAGAEPILRKGKLGRAALHGFLAAWGAAAYGAYFIR